MNYDIIFEKYPMTSLEDMPLHSCHGQANLSQYFFICRGGELYDWRCADCLLEAEFEVNILGDELVEWYQDQSSQPLYTTLSWLIKRAKYWGVSR